MVALGIFILTYVGVALGRVPGLAVDRVGVSLLGAIAMVVFGVISTQTAFAAIDLPTILLLYALMIVSAQLRLGGFYTWTAEKITTLLDRTQWFLFVGMLISAVLSALLANDIVCFAFAPVLVVAANRGRLNPLPFLLGLAVASNIGSAATLIGNPQNMLIGQVGHLDFGHFWRWCAPPSAVALLGGYLIIAFLFRHRMHADPPPQLSADDRSWPEFNAWQTGKGLVAVVLLVALFLTPIPREISAIGVAGVLLCSRRLKTRDMLGLVDWHLITLFCALFIVIQGIAMAHYPEMTVAALKTMGIDIRHPYLLTGVSALLSNLFSNVPATMLLIRFLQPHNPVQWYTLAVSSTFAGNFLVLGSIANLIVIEQAQRHGVRITFWQHAAVGIPVTLMSLGILIAWIAITG